MHKLYKPMLLLSLGLAALLPGSGKAQAPDSVPEKLRFWSFMDAYFAYSFAHKPDSSRLAPFFYSHNRHNAFALNNVILGATYTDSLVRGSLALHTGTYVQDNYAQEPVLLRHIFEANTGFRLVKDLWLEAGVFPSHIGFESAISADNWTLSRSLMAENSPYYETGARLSYEPTSRWLVRALVLNGWQVMEENNRYKALGTQVQFKPTPRLMLNYSTFLGNEIVQQTQNQRKRGRFFQNFFMQYGQAGGIQAALIADLGLQEKGANKISHWQAAALLVRYPLKKRLAAALRAEYYSDPNNIIIADSRGFRAKAASLTLSYAPAPPALARVEVRQLFGARHQFTTRSNQTILMLSMSIRF